MNSRARKAGSPNVFAGSFVCACLVACASVFAQGGQGPDVIVGDLPDVDNYGAATIGGVQYRVYAVGTTSCNLGTQRLTWLADTPLHPVISGNMYRIANGRFEQIGQQWLKHGFCALQGSVCSTNCQPNPTGCPALGVLCSDPYSAGLNGSQGGLGPKSEVNASTGVFPYPWINRGTSDNPTAFKRLRVPQADISVPNAQYFVSSIYIHPEDSQANNSANNQSYRRITFNANFEMQLQDSTQRMKPAVQAWRDHGLGPNQPDPSINVAPVDIPNDGRFIVASKATSIGGGRFRYDYAVQNLTSDRSGGSFRIPLPPNADASNPYFHDIEYHSGEPFNSNAWNAVITSDGITWTCPEPMSQNVNANALRWDTVYTFSFEAAVGPAAGVATIGLFKPGTVPSVGAQAYVPSPDGVTRPFNDSCQAPTPISAGTTNFSSTGASTDGPAEPNGCNAGGFNQFGNDVWFVYTSPTAGSTVVSTCGSSFDTKLAIYPAGACPAAGSLLACSDDSLSCTNGGSRLTFTSAAGTQYLIRIGGKNNASGDGVLSITAPTPPGPTPPANDGCAGSRWMADGETVTGSTTLATNEGSSTCTSSGGDVWFAYRPTVDNAIIRASTCGSAFNTVLSVHTGTCGSLTEIACNNDAQSGACAGTPQSLAAWRGVANTTYYIRLAGVSSSRGNFSINITGGGGVIPPAAPANDLCANRSVATLGTNNFTTTAAGTDGPLQPTCNFGAPVQQIANDVWYSFVATTSGRLDARAFTSGFAPEMAIYEGSGCEVLPQRIVSCGDQCAAPYGRTAAAVLGGQSYTIRVGGGQGNGRLFLGMNLCPTDLDNGSNEGIPDGGVTLDDLLYFIGAYEAGSAIADFDDGTGTGARDCGVTLDDLLYYLTAYDRGC